MKDMEFSAWQHSDEWKIGQDMQKDAETEGYPGIAHDFETTKLELEQLKRELHDANAALAESIHLLKQAREFILNQAARHDLNWREGHHIVDRIDYLFELGTVRDIQAQ